MPVLTTQSIVNCFFFRTPVSARSYRASTFLLDWLLGLFCQANKFIHSFIQLNLLIGHLLQLRLWVINRRLRSTHAHSLTYARLRCSPPPNRPHSQDNNTAFDKKTLRSVTSPRFPGRRGAPLLILRSLLFGLFHFLLLHTTEPQVQLEGRIRR